MATTPFLIWVMNHITEKSVKSMTKVQGFMSITNPNFTLPNACTFQLQFATIRFNFNDVKFSSLSLTPET